MADINERLDRLQRREEFDRFGRPLRPVPTELPVGPVVARPAGVDDRLGEVLDAVAAVVRRHQGLSVMVALADGRAGRPVIRVTERDGGVETGVVVVNSTQPRAAGPTPGAEPIGPPSRPPAEYGPYDGMSTPAAAPTRGSVPGSDPVFEPAFRDRMPAPEAREAAPANGRHAADRGYQDGADERPGAGWSGSSWHNSLWSRDRFRNGDQDGPATDEERPSIALPEDTSQVVSRLAQLLRENPSLAASWGREAQE